MHMQSKRAFQLAPWHESTAFPTEAESIDEKLVSVECHNLSTSGVLFLWPTVPDFKLAVLCLTADDQQKLLPVQIGQAETTWMNGYKQFCVRGEFLHRLDSAN